MTLPPNVIDLGAGFWNVRGSHRFGPFDIGTQCSLVRLASGRYVMLDAYTLDEKTRAWVDAETDGGAKIDAILLLHPFHTIHVPALHAQLPHAKLYGTKRHVGLFPALPWEPEHTEDAALHGRFANDQVLSVPRSIELVSSSSDAHFGSVLAFHRASHTLHVDDTIVHARHLRDRTRSRRPRSRSHRSHDHARRRVVRERARCLRRAQTSVPRVALE